jgi:DNA-binding CsgD family transcriptional regulator
MIVLTRQSGPSFRAFAAEHGLTLACVAMQSHLKLWELAHQQGNTSGSPLTPREREVLTLSARGLTTREVGESLGISVSGVNFHIANAARKLSANNRTHATSLAISAGYITP